jgi:hypothetical protein
MTFRIKTPSIIGLIATLRLNNLTLIITIFNLCMVIVMLSVIMLSVVVPSVVAPFPVPFIARI